MRQQIPKDYTIMLIEDDEVDRESIARLCKKHDLNLHWLIACDGYDALKQLQAFGKSDSTKFPNLILLDINLPKVNGFEILNYIRQHAKLAQIPVMILSTSSDEYDRALAQYQHVDHYVVKPIMYEDLDYAIKHSLYTHKGGFMYTVIVVDDDEIDRLAYRRYLERSTEQFEIIELSMGRELLALAHARKPDCIILDYHLPDINAEELIELLQNDEQVKDIPIIVLTGQGNEDTAANTLKLGAKDYLAKSKLNDINLADVIKTVISENQSESKKQNEFEHIKYMASHDHLTGLANRNQFEVKVKNAIEESQKNNRRFSLLLFDLNKFKPVNDTYGHEFGDELLKEVSRRIKHFLRSEDVVARIGGDEFAALLLDTKQNEAIALKAERLIEKISQPYTIGGKDVYISTSIGIANYPECGQDYKTLLNCADVAMYHAKSNHEGTFRFYSESFSKELTQLDTIKSNLIKSLKYNELKLAFRPSRDLKTSELRGVTAYIKWESEQYTSLTSNIILSYADQVSLMSELGEWMLNNACYQLQIWQRQHAQTLHCFLPITPSQLADPRFIPLCESITQRYDIEPNQIVFVTKESAITMRNKDIFLNQLRKLNEHGFLVGLNEILLNELSLLDLFDLPVQYLFIDKSIMLNLISSKVNFKLAKTILYLGSIFDFQVVVDGVKSQDQILLLNKYVLNDSTLYTELQPQLLSDVKVQLNRQVKS